MATPRLAVLFRIHFWDDFARRAAQRVYDQAAGADFFVLANETGQRPFDVTGFKKVGFVENDLANFGLPCIAGESDKEVMWWNCDYPLYVATLLIPDYDYYFVLDFDAAVNTQLLPIAEAMAYSGVECVTSFPFNPILSSWSHAASCSDMPYTQRNWVALISLFASARVAKYLLAERQRLGRAAAGRDPSHWPLCEGFVASALANLGVACGTLSTFADVQDFGTELVFLESDPRAQRPRSFAHSVLDAPRFWAKFKARTFHVLMGEAEYDRLTGIRRELLRSRQIVCGGWRVAAGIGNLALDRPATQSSLSNSSRRPMRVGLDALSVDARGGNCGVLNGHHGFHTEIEDAPWWSVDLQSEQAIDEVCLFNRTESPERARRLSIHTSLDGRNWSRVYQKTDDAVFVGVDQPLRCRLGLPTVARHVRVMLDRRDWFHLDEVEVYGPSAATGVPQIGA